MRHGRAGTGGGAPRGPRGPSGLPLRVRISETRPLSGERTGDGIDDRLDATDAGRSVSGEARGVSATTVDDTRGELVAGAAEAAEENSGEEDASEPEAVDETRGELVGHAAVIGAPS